MASARLKSPHTWTRIAFQIAKVGLIAHVFTRYIGGIGAIEGISMVPTIPAHYRSTPRILYSTLHRRGRGVKVDDIITYTHPMFPNTHGYKRVIGMPNDFVSVITPSRGDANAKAVDVEGNWAVMKEQIIQVPEGHCWAAGDILEWSRDSRLFGPLPLFLRGVMRSGWGRAWMSKVHRVDKRNG